MGFILWIIAVVLVIAGIVQLFQGQILLGVGLIILGFLVGPGGVSIFRLIVRCNRSTRLRRRPASSPQRNPAKAAVETSAW